MSRWICLEETSPSGKSLFQCSLCGRVSYTPDKVCVDGCGYDEVTPEFLKSLEEENRLFEKLLADMAHNGD